MAGSLLPWWGWALAMQAILTLALFEYVRRLTTLNGEQAYGLSDADFCHRLDEVQQVNSKLSEKYERLSEDYVQKSVFETRLRENMEATASQLSRIRNLPTLFIELSEKIIEVKDIAIDVRGVFYAYREQALGSMSAISIERELGIIERDVRKSASLLRDRLSAGEIYNLDAWAKWEILYQEWNHKLTLWLNIAYVYGDAIKKRVLSIDEDEYYENFLVKDSQFPNSNAVQKFKKFHITQTQWESLVLEVMNNVQAVAFRGLTASEVRNGSEPG